MRSWLSVLITDAESKKVFDIPIAPSLYSLSNKMDNSLLAVRDINHKYIVVACLFAQKGFKNVTMKDICTATGLSRGGLYRHYDSTQQIFSEIMDMLMNAQDNELSEKMAAGLPARQILEEILERYRMEMLDSSASLSVAIYEFFSENFSDGQDNLLLRQYQYSVDMWSEFLAYGIKRGEFKQVECVEIIDIIIFSYQGVRMYSTIIPLDEEIPMRIINHIKKTLLV